MKNANQKVQDAKMHEEVNSKKFRFIRDDIFLIASRDPALQKYYLEFVQAQVRESECEYSDKIEIDSEYHVIFHLEREIRDISQQDDPELAESEVEGYLQEERDWEFGVYCNFVERLSKSGITGLYFFQDLEQHMDPMCFPAIVKFLFHNLVEIDKDFILRYLIAIERECNYDGEYHLESLEANLGIILKEFCELDLMCEQEYHDVHISIGEWDRVIDFMRTIIQLHTDYHPIARLLCKILIRDDSTFFDKFLKRIQEDDTDHYGSVEIEGWHVNLDLLLSSLAYMDFFNEYKDMNHYIPLNTEKRERMINHIQQLTEFKPDYMFHLDNNRDDRLPDCEGCMISTRIKSVLASEARFVHYPQYSDLFWDEDEVVQKYAAANPNAPSLPDYKILFGIWTEYIRKAVAANPNAAALPDYHKLLKDKSFVVRRAVLHNKNAVHLIDRRFYFPAEWGDNLDDILKHSDASSYPEYGLLCEDPDPWLRKKTTAAAERKGM